MRNKLAFDLFREIPHIASLRTQFYHLKVTYTVESTDPQTALSVGLHPDEDFGLFTHVEKWVKSIWLRVVCRLRQQPLMATSNSPTYGQSNSPRQDG